MELKKGISAMYRAMIGRPGQGGMVAPEVRSLERLRDRHAGQRAFILGSGPSMRLPYLELLRNEVTFAFNGMCKLFAEAHWWPSYYMIHDEVVARSLEPYLHFPPEQEVLAGLGSHASFKHHPATTVYKIPYPASMEGPIEFRTRLEHGLQGGYTVAFAALQMAWYMGIREVYLLGVDIAYQVQVDRTVGDYHAVRTAEGDLSGSYFDPRLSERTEIITLPNEAGMMRALGVAKEFFEANGGRIFNAAPDSPLALFPRKHLGAVLGSATGMDQRNERQTG